MILAAATLVLGFTPERNVAAGDNKVKILNFETDDKNAAAPPRPRVHVYDMPLSVSFEYDEARPRLKPFESYTGGYRQYRTEALIPELVRASAHYEPDPDKADLFLVPFRGLARFYKHRDEPGGLEKVDAEYVAAVQWLEAQPGGFFRSRPADHMWIFGSGRGASIFPSWREHIADCIFIGPEGDERTGQVAPHDKDVIVPGYFAAAPPAVQSAALKSQAVRPILAHFRGSYTSARPGEEDFSEGVRLALMRATTAFRLPRHVMARKLSSGVGAYKASPFVVSNASIDPESYAREMQNADFCLCPMGSSSWTLRIYQAIASGCIPVLLSDHISLPFDYTDSPVDWRKIAIKWPQRDVTGLLAHLCSWSEADIAATRARVLNTAPMLLWNGPDSGALAQTMRYLTTDRPSHRPSRAASAWWGRGGEPVAPPVDALPMALPPPAQPTVPLDVLVMVKEMGCVTDQSVSALRNHVRPHTIHIVADRCEGGGSGGGSVKVDTCTETRNVMPEFPLEMAKQLMAALHPEVPAERTEWLYQQLLKFKSVLSLGLGTSVLVWDGDTVLTRPFPLPLLDERGTALLLQGTRYDSPAYFNKSGALPVGYAESTRKLLGVSPPWDTSFVVQWQVWERALVKEMTRLIESRSHEPWYLAMLRSVSDASTGLSEYTLYGTYATQWHAERIRVASSSEVLWLRDHPLGLLDGDGTCCPSQERLRDIATGGFVYVSWECSHKSELRLLPELWDRAGTGPLARRRLLENSAPPSAAPYAPPSAAPYAPPSAAPYAPPSAAPYAPPSPPSASPSPPPAYAPPSPPSASPSPPPLPPLVPGLVPVETTSFTISFDESVRRLLRALQQTVTFTISFEKIKTAVVDTIAAESVTDITTDQITVEPVDGNPNVLKVTIYPKEGQTASQILDAISSDPNTLLQNIGEELGENVPTPSFVVNPSIVTVGVAPPPPPPPAKKRGWVVAVAVCVPLGVALLALGVYLLVKKGKLSVPGYGSDRPSMTKHTVTEGV